MLEEVEMKANKAKKKPTQTEANRTLAPAWNSEINFLSYVTNNGNRFVFITLAAPLACAAIHLLAVKSQAWQRANDGIGC